MPKIKNITTDDKGNVEITSIDDQKINLVKSELENITETNTGGKVESDDCDIYFHKYYNPSFKNKDRMAVRITRKGISPGKNWWNMGDASGIELGMVIFSTAEFSSYVDILIENNINLLRIDIPSYQNKSEVDKSKNAVKLAVSKGAKVIWGVSSNPGDNESYTITSKNWLTFRKAIIDSAKWANDNGVYEFQIGNEEENHTDESTIRSWCDLTPLLKDVASEVKKIFTNGKVSYSCADDSIDMWGEDGKGDIDILASNLYMESHIDWKTGIDKLVNYFGADTYLTEFSLHPNAIEDYSADEKVQADSLNEMVKYIKQSGMKRMLFFSWQTDAFGIIKSDGNYRVIWDVLRSING